MTRTKQPFGWRLLELDRGWPETWQHDNGGEEIYEVEKHEGGWKARHYNRGTPIDSRPSLHGPYAEFVDACRRSGAHDVQAKDRVNTRLGYGTVKYLRMAPPAYRHPEAVSVVLDRRTANAAYSGTIFAAHEVAKH